MIKLILLTIALLGLGIAGIAIKIWAKKDGEFAGTCASNSSVLNNGNEASCTVCGARPDEKCKS